MCQTINVSSVVNVNLRTSTRLNSQLTEGFVTLFSCLLDFEARLAASDWSPKLGAWHGLVDRRWMADSWLRIDWWVGDSQYQSIGEISVAKFSLFFFRFSFHFSYNNKKYDYSIFHPNRDWGIDVFHLLVVTHWSLSLSERQEGLWYYNFWKPSLYWVWKHTVRYSCRRSGALSWFGIHLLLSFTYSMVWMRLDHG